MTGNEIFVNNFSIIDKALLKPSKNEKSRIYKAI